MNFVKLNNSVVNVNEIKSVVIVRTTKGYVVRCFLKSGGYVNVDYTKTYNEACNIVNDIAELLS